MVQGIKGAMRALRASTALVAFLKTPSNKAFLAGPSFPTRSGEKQSLYR